MLYINFVVITDTPVRLKNFLIARGILEEVEQPALGGGTETVLRGTRPGMEWVRVPNPIIKADLTPDDRNVYLVKFAHESLDNEVDGEVTADTYDWSKFGKWVKANGASVNAPVGWTINGEPAGSAWKITGEQVWLVRTAPERFGVWQ
jgi:hypothetical protein